MIRETALKLLGQLDTNTLVQMLGAAGVNIQDHLPKTDYLGEQPEKIPSWNDLTIKVKSDKRGPLVSTKPAVAKMGPGGVRGSVPAYLDEQESTDGAHEW